MSPRWSKRLFAVHRWTGLISGINVLILSLTGAYLVFGEDIEHWLAGSPQQEQHVRQGGPDAAFNTGYDQIVADDPDARVLRLRPAKDDAPLHEFGVINTDEHGVKSFEKVWVDRVTGLSTDPVEQSGEGFTHWVLHLHADLFLGSIGTILLGLMGLLFMVSCVTGLIVYLPRSFRTLFGEVRWRRRWAIILGDWHKHIGICSLVFNLVIAFTGVALTLGFLLAQVWMLKEAQSQSSGQEQLVWDGSADLDLLHSSALDLFPDSEVDMIYLPEGPQGDQHFLVLAKGSDGANEFLPMVAVAPIGEPENLYALNLPWWVNIIGVSAPLHFGNFGGWPVKVIYLLLGLTSGLLSVSGYILCFRKTFNRKRHVKVP